MEKQSQPPALPDEPRELSELDLEPVAAGKRVVVGVSGGGRGWGGPGWGWGGWGPRWPIGPRYW